MRSIDRRSLLVATAAVPAALTAPALAHGAAADPIVALYAERQRLYLICKAASDAGDGDGAAHDALWNEIFDLERRIAEMPATTLEGTRIKLHLTTIYTEASDDLDNRLVRSALADLQRFTA